MWKYNQLRPTRNRRAQSESPFGAVSGEPRSAAGGATHASPLPACEAGLCCRGGFESRPYPEGSPSGGEALSPFSTYGAGGGQKRLLFKAGLTLKTRKMVCRNTLSQLKSELQGGSPLLVENPNWTLAKCSFSLLAGALGGSATRRLPDADHRPALSSENRYSQQAAGSR